MDYLLYPSVKKSIARIAWACICIQGLSLIAIILTLLEVSILLTLDGEKTFFLIFIQPFNYILSLLFISGIGILLPWCHSVLLAHRGHEFTRYFSLLALIFAFITLISTGYSLITGEVLLASQDNAPLLLAVIIITCGVMNLDSMRAASVRARIQINLIAPLSLIIISLSEIGEPFISNLLRFALFFVSYPLLKLLAQSATCIIQLPSLEEEGEESEESKEGEEGEEGEEKRIDAPASSKQKNK